ncbi:hypothetical protein OIU34_23145 [Pararhizobium sp. BT-229]|uniref:hypothetical protein n=1 Tax=Pararhizobium sp. BT-229 TaxID=2986923 RepID=UPI0021F7B77C|nr:hypothetical protein [Pararhizobium sp. BT-229]MCV9964792.1 hypothetical protein [Pararhizobium sp. BT-229]
MRSTLIALFIMGMNASTPAFADTSNDSKTIYRLAYKTEQSTNEFGVKKLVLRTMASFNTLAGHDRVFDFEDMQRLATRPGRDVVSPEVIRGLLQLDLDGDHKVQVDEMRVWAEAEFGGKDRNEDGIIDAGLTDELRREAIAAIQSGTRTANRIPTIATAPNVIATELPTLPVPVAERHHNARPECALPGVGANEKLVLFGNGAGTRQASVTLGGDNGDHTHLVDVVVEPGADSLYVVLTSYEATLWRFTGAVERISRVAATSVRREDNSGEGLGGSGVTGIPRDRVSFLGSWNCLMEFRGLGGVDEAQVRGRLFDILGRQPDIKGGAQLTSTLRIPSMTLDAAERGSWDNLPMVDVDPDDVVAAVPVKRWDIMPGKAGIQQLLDSGYIESIPNGNSDEYRIVKTFPRFPTGLTGGMQPKFLLSTGVPLPGGSPGWACVISEESGQSVSPRSPMCN